MTLTKDERETIINYSDADDKASVYTCNASLKRKLKKLGYSVVRSDSISATFECPKRCISFRSPKPQRRKPMSEKQKQKMAEGKQMKLEMD
jgi:hypothetical protein